MSTPASPTPASSNAGSAAQPARLPGSLEANKRIARWVKVHKDGTIELTPGKVDIGQGISTALAQIAADELGVRLERIRMVRASTAFSPDEGVTSGSQSIQESGTAIRWVCAEVRAIYLAAAAERLGVPADRLRIEDGAFLGDGNLASSYWELADDRLLDRDATATAKPLPVTARRIAGQSAQRLDIPDKVFGRPRFLHDQKFEGMLHGRAVRPARPGAALANVEEAKAKAMPGVVAVVRDGNFLGVVAESERAAILAHETLTRSATWEGGADLPDSADLETWLRRQPAETTISARKDGQAAGEKHETIRRQYTKPYIAHASIGPSIAIATWTAPDRVEVVSHSQGIYNLRTDLAKVLGLPPENVVVAHGEGSGCYGHNAADDVALDAALLARAVPGKPVRLLWTRADELAWGPLGPAQTVAIEADLDASGEVIAWRHDIWANGHTSRPGRAKVPTLLAGYHIAKAFPMEPAVNPALPTGGGADRNSQPAYDFPNWVVTNHRLLEMPVRASAMRSLGGFANVFAIESFVDELAAKWGEDPVAWRLRHLPDPRARAVVEAAARRAGWANWQKREGVGHGIGYARYKHNQTYCAVVAEIEVDTAVRVRRLVAAVDAGEVINPDGLINQTEGGCIQAASWTLLETVRFEDGRVTSDSWEAYPILKFSEVPRVEVEVINRPEERGMGGGEHTMGPVAAAIANAVYDALGVRVYELPITPERIVAAMG
jgi:CO/xanthine dehydrogenase Mo-binding subunit